MRNKEYILDFHIPSKGYKQLIGFDSGRYFRQYFENIGVDFEKLEDTKTILFYIPDSILTIDIEFVNGFMGDRIKENGLNIFLKYDFYSDNFVLGKVVYQSVKYLIENLPK